MNKYIKRAPTSDLPQSQLTLGIIEFCIYLITSFPGTPLPMASLIQRLSLYLFLGQSILLILLNILNAFEMHLYCIWYGIFAFISLILIVLIGGEIISDAFFSVIICFVLSVAQSVYIKTIDVIRVVCLCHVLCSVFNSLYLYFTGQMILNEGERLGSEFATNPNTLATFLMYSVVYAIWLSFLEKRLINKLLTYIVIVIIAYPLMLTGGRKFVIAPLAFFIIFYLLAKRNNTPVLLRMIVVFFVVFLAWIMIENIPSLYNSIGYRLEGLFNSYFGGGKVDSSTILRSRLRSLAISGWLESPLLGKGFDTFKYYSASNGLPLTYSHSNITELLYSGGVVLLLTYYSAYIYIIHMFVAKRCWDVNTISFCIAGIFMQLLFDYGGVSFNLYDTQLFNFFLLTMAEISLHQGDSLIIKKENSIQSHYIIQY